MYLLDTNILSELMRPNPSLAVVDWLDNHSPLFISSITQAELLTGALLMADGKKKSHYLRLIDEMLQVDFANRILAFGGDCAYQCAILTAKRQKHGRIIHLADAQIASIALVYELVLVTRNTKDFVMIDGLQVVNPF